jgi:hypothetical protein
MLYGPTGTAAAHQGAPQLADEAACQTIWDETKKVKPAQRWN